jgi:hypothetical protein
MTAKLHQFLKEIGITQKDACPPLFFFTPQQPFEPFKEESLGYIKFQSLSIKAESDLSQADQFETWLQNRIRSKGFKYLRGFPGIDTPDRRFYLNMEAATEVERLVVKYGRDVVEE